MEQNNRQTEDNRPVIFGIPAAGLLPGIILVTIGGLFLLGNLHIVHAAEWFAYWPVILIAVGLVQLVDANHPASRTVGAVLMGVGGLFLADNLGYLSFDVGDLWPLILIAIGVVMLVNRMGWGGQWWGGRWWGGAPYWYGGGRRSWSRDWTYADSRQDSRGYVHEVSIFGGSKRQVVSQDFRGGRVSSIFGGITLDLTGAQMSGSQAVLEVSAIYGGVSIRIPPSWNVETRGAGIFGGFADHTIHPPYSADTKRLVVRGAGIFGGVVIKN